MNPNQTAAYHALEQAHQARKIGDKHLARQYATQAANLAPELEEVWLMMAALASPRASIVFLQNALKINPNSERARKGMHWAVDRLRKTTPRNLVYASVAARPALIKKPFLQPRFSYAAVFLAVAALIMLWGIWNVTPAAASLINSSIFTGGQAAPSWAPVDLAKPIHKNTLAASATLAPTASPVRSAATPQHYDQQSLGANNQSPSAKPAMATFTPVAYVSATELPALSQENRDDATVIEQATQPPTGTPSPLPSDTSVPVPTDTNSPTPLAIASPTEIDVAFPSPTALPTDTAIPEPTQPTPHPVPVNSSGGTGGARWIDVDLTNQMVYAYEGNTIVNSFLVSTGTWQHPTVTGQYHVYVKYRYANMSGPGYYLPNVPYTMYFYKGYGLHGTYWHSNFGTPMSHGCVNLSIPDAGWLYEWTSVGTLVNVHY